MTEDEARRKEAKAFLERLNADQDPRSQSQSILAVRAQIELVDKNYPEALQSLFDLTKSFPELRIIYNRVQDVYARTQKGKGEVSLTPH